MIKYKRYLKFFGIWYFQVFWSFSSKKIVDNIFEQHINLKNFKYSFWTATAQNHTIVVDKISNILGISPNISSLGKNELSSMIYSFENILNFRIIC